MFILLNLTNNKINHLLISFSPVRMENTAKHLNMQKQPPEVFYKKGVLENSVKFTGRHMRRSLLFNKVAGLRLATLLKKRL